MASRCRTDLACPRCGYDLSALPPAWGDACPLLGTCSECGHVFDWRERFDPARRDLPGFVEHASGRPATLKAAWVTLWWTLSWSFWRRTRVEHRTIPVRMFLWVVLTLGGLHLVAASLAAARMTWLLRGAWGSSAPPGSLSTEGFLTQVVAPYAYPFAAVWWGRGVGSMYLMAQEWPEPVLGAVVLHVMAFAMMFVIPTTRRLARVRPAHVLRAGVYGLSMLAPLALFRIGRNAVVLFEIAATGARAQVVTVPGGGATLRLGGPMPLFIDAVPEGALWVFLAGWVGAWWYLALRQGWGVPRAGLVWVVLAIPCALAAGVVIAYRALWVWS